MASTKDNHLGSTGGTAIKVRPFLEIAETVKSGHSNYNDILELFNVGTSIPDEEENFEVTKLLCEVLDSKIPLTFNLIDKLKLDACDWFGLCLPSLFSTKIWKRALALKLLRSIRKLIGNIELSVHVQWESLRNTLLRHIDILMDLVCDRDTHWFDVWIVTIDILGNKLALNTNRPLLNKMFKVLSPFKEDFQKFPNLQEVVREVPFKLLTVACWQKVVDYWLQGTADVPLNHVMTIIRFFKRLDAELPLVRAKVLCMWRVVCLLTPGHMGLQPSIDQLFAMLLNHNASKAGSKSTAASGSSNLELVPDIVSEILALMLGANLCPDHELVVSSELLLPTHDLIGVSSVFLQKVLQCFEKLFLINPSKNAIKPNDFALKTGFSCFLSKLNSNPSNDLINNVLKLPQNIYAQANDSVVLLSNCIDVVVRGIVCGSHCFGDNIMTSSKYYSGSMDLMTGSPTLMLSRYLLDKTKLELLDIDAVISILEVLIPKGTKTIHYIRRIVSLMKSLCTDESITHVAVLKVWQILVVSINNQYRCEADFTRETPDLGWVYSVILFPLNNFNDQYWIEIAHYVGSKDQSELLSKLLNNDTKAEDAIVICEALASKLDRLLLTENESRIPAITAATRALVTSTPFSKFPRGKRFLKVTFLLVANLVNLKCLTEGLALELIKTIEALSFCLDGYLPTLLNLSSLVVGLLSQPSQDKCVTDSVLIMSLMFIETAEKEYGTQALPCITKLKAAYQYCETVAKANESCSLTPKRILTANSVLTPAPVRRITPKRVGPLPSISLVTVEDKAAQAKKKPLVKLQAAVKMSLSADTGPTEEVEKHETPKKLTAFGRPRGPLTKHQREKMLERQDNIPALYVDLTQESQALTDSQQEFTQDSSSLVVPQRFKVSAAFLETKPNVESRPFASVVQKPLEVPVGRAKAYQKERGKAVYDMFQKNKQVALPPIHLKKVHVPSGTDKLIDTSRPEEPLAVSQDRPFKAFSPANKNKSELATMPATDNATEPHTIARKCLLPKTDFSQDIVLDSQKTEIPPALGSDDGIAMFQTEINSPVKMPIKIKKPTPKRNSLNFKLENTSKRKSLKREMSNSFEDSEPNEPLSKKKSWTSQGNAAAREGTALSALPGFIDDSSNNSTDSNMSGSCVTKRCELKRLHSNLIVNESPLPVKRVRKSIGSNGDAKVEKSLKSSNSSKSQALYNSDCDSVASEVSSSFEASITKKQTRRSRRVPAGLKEDLPDQINSSFEVPQQSLKPINKPKTRSSIGKKSVAELVLPETQEKSQKKAVFKNTVVNLVNLKSIPLKPVKKSLKKKAYQDLSTAENIIPDSITTVTPKKDSQNLLKEDHFLQSSSVAAPPLTLILKDNVIVDDNCIVNTTTSVVGILVPETNLTKGTLLPPSLNKKHENSSNEALSTHKEMSCATPVVNEDREKESIPLVCLDSDVRTEGSGSETCKDLLLNHNTNRIGSDLRPGDECLNLASDKENKIVEESQDFIIPCSQSQRETFKMLATKRKNTCPKILSRSFVKSAPKVNVLLSVSVVPETQIEDTRCATENTPSPTLNPTPEPATEAVTSNKTYCLEQQRENGELALAENPPVLNSEIQEVSSSSNAVHILLPETPELNLHNSYTSDQIEETAVVIPKEDNEVSNSLVKEALLKDATVMANELENDSGKDIKSPPRPGPKVMENLSPSMLRLLHCTNVQKVTTLEPTCRSKKMLQMVLPFVSETSVRMKAQVEKQEGSIYIDQTFPTQECLVGEDGTPVFRDWKKCVPSPSSVPTRSSMKGSLKKNESGKNRKLCFPFEPTTKVLFYYENKNSKCNDNISQIKIKKKLRKKRKAEQVQKAMADSEKEALHAFSEDINSSCGLVEVVLPSDEPSLTKSSLFIINESPPSAINDSHLPGEELVLLPELQTAEEESAALVSSETLESTLPVGLTISPAAISKAGECEPINLDNTELITFPSDTPVFSTSQEMEPTGKTTVILTDPLSTEIKTCSNPTSASKSAAMLNATAETASHFEDSYHDYLTPTPLSLPDPEQLNGTDPLYKDLVDCQQPIAFMVPSLTTPQWQGVLNEDLAERNILTVGDFCRRTERQIDLLHIKGNKVKTVLQALNKYKSRLQIGDAGAKDLLKGLECNKHSREVFDKLYPLTKNSMNTSETQTCSKIADTMHNNFIKNVSNDRLLNALQESGKFTDDNFVGSLVKKIEPRKYILMHCNSGSVDNLSLELANSINMLPVEARTRHIYTLLSHLKFRD